MTLGPRPVLALALPAIAGTLMALSAPAGAQQDAPKGDGLERAQKAADAVFHWIKLNADKGANRQAPAPAPAPAPRKAAPVAAAPRPAPAVAAASPVPPAASNTVGSAASPAPAPAPAPVAATAAATAEPEPERTPVVLAAAAPTPSPAAPLAVAAKAAQAPAAPAPEPEEPLRLLSKVEPVLPRQLQQPGSFRSGVVQVQFTVAPDGSVQQASIIKASHSRLGTAALEAVRQWRFAPVRQAREAAVEVAFKSDVD